MSRFTSLNNWYAPTKGIRFRTTQEVPWEIGNEGSGLWITVPVDYEFDVSIPWTLRWLFDPKNPRYLKAGALHDYALHELNWTRVAAAAAFSEALRAEKVSLWRRLPMVLGVIVHKFT
jgi:hypothetical protein